MKAMRRATNWPLNDDHVAIRGSIDVIYGNDSGYVFILDYKTGSVLPSAAEIERHEKNQLSLYLLAYTQKNPQQTAAALMYHQLYRQDQHGITVKLCDPDKKEQILGNSRKRPKPLDASFFHSLTHHLSQMRQLQLSGCFSPFDQPKIPNPIKKRPSTCASCDHKLVCRYPKRFEGDRW